MIDSVLAEFNWPANAKNAARAGYVAAQRLAAAQPVAAPSGNILPGWQMVPEVPTPKMLACIVHRKHPEDWEAGKKLQDTQRGEGRVPFKTEYEQAVGQYQRLLSVAREVIAAQAVEDRGPA